MFVSFCYIPENFMKAREIFRTLLNVCDESFCKESQPFCIFTKSSEAVAQRCSVKKMFLELSQNSQEKQLCQSLFFNKVADLSLFSSEFREISKNTFSYRTPPAAVSESSIIDAWQSLKYASDFISHFKVINFLRLWGQ